MVNIYVKTYTGWLTCPKKKFHTISRYRLSTSTNILVCWLREPERSPV